MDLTRNNFAVLLRSLPNFRKVVVSALVDLFVLCILVLVSYMLRVVKFGLPTAEFLRLYFFGPLVSVVSLGHFGIYKSSARGRSTRTEVFIVIALLVTLVFWTAYVNFGGATGFSRSIFIIFPVLVILALVSLRRAASWLLSEKSARHSRGPKKPVLIFGAGREGLSLVEALERQGKFRPVAFVNTDYTVVGRTMRGLPVHAIDELDDIIKRYKPSEALIAKRGQTRSHRRTLLSKFTEQNLAVKIVPNVDEITDGNVSVDSIRAVRIEDLLGRDSVPPDETLMKKAVGGQRVLITGAGGSIGSELCRQALAFGANCLVLVENSEFALFEIHRELEELARRGQIAILPVLATILDGDQMRKLMIDHKIDIVFHAAAHKHVRMVQENALAGIQNNDWGTKTLAEAAIVAGVKRFILISTDKAVRPTNIMGATKRVAEMIIQALAAKPITQPIFSIVRFGNVWGSTGSVVPLFREQIAAGGPVLVTHHDVTRYFMLIPEAAQLVIQAAAMAEGGEVFFWIWASPLRFYIWPKA